MSSSLLMTLIVLLAGLNFGCVYFFRSSTTFSVYPGTLAVLLFLVLGGYLVGLVFELNPAPLATTVSASKGKASNVAPDPATRNEIIYKTKLEEARINLNDSLRTVCSLLNLLIVQSFFAFVAALVCRKKVKTRRIYYNWFVALHLLLMGMYGAVELFIKVRQG
jgi:hypothetical protein